MIGCLIAMTLLPAAFIIGCSDNQSPSTPMGLSGPTATPTITRTPAPTATPQAAQTPVNLLSAGSFVVLAYSTITNVGHTTLCGDLGLSPGSAVVGAPIVTCGGVYHVTDTAAASAKVDLSAAYTDAGGRINPALVAGDLGGQTLYPGLYKSTSSLMISSGDLTLDAQGNPNGVFIFQVASILSTGSNRKVILAGGAKATNVFWQVGSSCVIASNSKFVGTIMAHTQINLNIGASLVGRAMSEIEQVTLNTNVITKPAP